MTTDRNAGWRLDEQDIDRALAFIDGVLPPVEAERFLAERAPAERAALLAMRADAKALRAMRAPAAPGELHDLVMAAAERIELLAGNDASETRAGLRLVPAPHGSAWDAAGEHAAEKAGRAAPRPWALRWQGVGSLAAMVAMAVAVGWAVWPRGTPRASELPGEPPIVPVAFTPQPVVQPVAAPYALVFEVDDPVEGEALVRSLIDGTPGAQLTNCCVRRCQELMEGPPQVIGEGRDAAELMYVADSPTHQLVLPSCELARVLGQLVGVQNGLVDERRGVHCTVRARQCDTVELPIFIVPSKH